MLIFICQFATNNFNNFYFFCSTEKQIWFISTQIWYLTTIPTENSEIQRSSGKNRGAEKF